MKFAIFLLMLSAVCDAKEHVITDTANDFRFLALTDIFTCTPAAANVTCVDAQGVKVTFKISSVTPKGPAKQVLKMVLLNQRRKFEKQPKQYVQLQSRPNKPYSSVDGLALAGQTFSYLNWGNVTQPYSVENVGALKNGRLVDVQMLCAAAPCDVSYRAVFRQMIQSLQIAPYTTALVPSKLKRPPQDFLNNSAIQNLMKDFE